MEAEALIRDIWSRWNAGERDPDAVGVDPGIEVTSALAGRVYRGRDGLREWIAEIDEQFEAWELSLDELREIGPGKLIGHGAIRARGRHSGLDLDQPASWLLGVRDGHLSRIVNFIGADARERAERAIDG